MAKKYHPIVTFKSATKKFPPQKSIRTTEKQCRPFETLANRSFQYRH